MSDFTVLLIRLSVLLNKLQHYFDNICQLSMNHSFEATFTPRDGDTETGAVSVLATCELHYVTQCRLHQSPQSLY